MKRMTVEEKIVEYTEALKEVFDDIGLEWKLEYGKIVAKVVRKNYKYGGE